MVYYMSYDTYVNGKVKLFLVGQFCGVRTGVNRLEKLKRNV